MVYVINPFQFIINNDTQIATRSCKYFGKY